MEIKAPPQIKMVLVLNDLTELNDLLNERWKIASNFPHGSGAIFMLAKD